MKSPFNKCLTRWVLIKTDVFCMLHFVRDFSPPDELVSFIEEEDRKLRISEEKLGIAVESLPNRPEIWSVENPAVWNNNGSLFKIRFPDKKLRS